MLDYTFPSDSNEPWFRASEKNCFWNISLESKEHWMVEKRIGTRAWGRSVIGMKDKPIKKKEQETEEKGGAQCVEYLGVRDTNHNF